MATVQDNLLAWLKDAYAMEQQAIEILEKQPPMLNDYPDMQAKVRDHIEQTRSQAERLRTCLQRHGTDTSALKTGMAQLTGNVTAMMGSMSSDAVVKQAIADYAFENFEIANYRALISAAEEAGDMETRRVCEEILREEEAMASWIEDHLPVVTRQYLQRDADMQYRSARGG
ncbi:MAG TPA: ferritin-like domain-containing protein [Azospirillaceae bacterium]|nr:ferritin-like domain-containing protein [Azospirillaceae bacterium]